MTCHIYTTTFIYKLSFFSVLMYTILIWYITYFCPVELHDTIFSPVGHENHPIFDLPSCLHDEYHDHYRKKNYNHDNVSTDKVFFSNSTCEYMYTDVYMNVVTFIMVIYDYLQNIFKRLNVIRILCGCV